MRGITTTGIMSVLLLAGCSCDTHLIGNPPVRDFGTDRALDTPVDVDAVELAEDVPEEVLEDFTAEDVEEEDVVTVDCDDGIFCNGVETYDPETDACISGTYVDCSSVTDQCNTGICDETFDRCVAVPLPDTTACDDGDVCTEDDHCDGMGSCTGTLVSGVDWWEILPEAPIAPRNGHMAVWTGSEMFVWGGYDGSTRFADGALYSPPSGTWSTVSSTGAPLTRSRAEAHWTGSEVIIWGGATSSAVLGDGAMYDPATDSWRDISSTGAPSARSSIASVWTGSEMIVWGGSTNISGGPFVDTGARFDPSTGTGGTWTTVPVTTGTPSARGAALAAWTGSEMIVWGGASGTATAHNDGASYDPATDTWTPLPASDAMRRYQSIGIWTGTNFLFWGGWNFSGPSLSHGASHLFGTSSWDSLSESPLPTGHSRHSEVWTGHEMYVWGGHNYGHSPWLLNDGARYNPASDTWTMMAYDSSITARTHHSTVWTGQQMIVFGGGLGEGTAITTAVGAVYTFCPDVSQ
jgi:N-acetylneuraminic acid mutarotase